MSLAYSFFFLMPFVLPVIPYVSLLPVLLGVALLPFARAMFFPSRAVGTLVCAAMLSGLFFTGIYLAAIDSAMRGAHGATWQDVEFLQSTLVFTLSPYGIGGAATLGLVAYVSHHLAIKVRTLWSARVP